MKDAIEDIKYILKAKSEGKIEAPQRTVLDVPAEEASALYMPSADLANQMAAVKVVTIFPGNPAAGLPTTQGIIILSSVANGAHLAAMNASYLTRLRTGAMSAIATDYLARQNAAKLAVIGTGAMAFEQCLGVMAVRDIQEITLYNRTQEKTKEFAARLRNAGYTGSFTFETEDMMTTKGIQNESAYQQKKN